MLKNTYDDQDCPVASTLELVGERWTILIIRDALLGMRRFDEFLTSLGVARTVLSARLRMLVANGILERVPYQDRPVRHEYLLTPKGRELSPIIISLMYWGNKYLPNSDGGTRRTEHLDCGGEATTQFVCTDCGRPIGVGEAATVVYSAHDHDHAHVHTAPIAGA